MVAMLLVSLPVMFGMAVLLTTSATHSLTVAAEQTGQSVAREVSLKVQDWLSERRQSLTVLAATAADANADDPTGEEARSVMAQVAETGGNFTLIQVTDLDGQVLSTSGTGGVTDPAEQEWFARAAEGQPVLTSPVRRGDHIEWVMAQPVLGPDGNPQAIVIGTLDPARLADLLELELAEVIAVDSQNRLVYSSEDMGQDTDEAAMLAAGALSTTVENAATQEAASTGRPGVARFTDLEGHDVIAGYDLVEDLSWTIVAEVHADALLAPVTTQRQYAIALLAVGTLLAVGAALLFGVREARNLRGLAARTTAAGVEVNSAATELSASSDELAATTTEQSAG
ncbi:cache domain-containing protein, partial [Promicromonospora sp. AC04]